MQIEREAAFLLATLATHFAAQKGPLLHSIARRPFPSAGTRQTTSPPSMLGRGLSPCTHPQSAERKGAFRIAREEIFSAQRERSG